MERVQLTGGKLNVGGRERMISLGAGALLAFVGLRRSFGSLLLAGLGGYLVYRGVTGNCKVYDALDMDTSKAMPGGEPVRQVENGSQFQSSVTLNRSPAEVYLFWRNLENLPRFMQFLESVTVTGNGTSHWVAKTPVGGLPLEWDARITDERPNEMIAWGSLPGSSVTNTGRVRFVPAPGGRGTEVHVNMAYRLPGGTVGAAMARLLNKVTKQTVKEDLRRFKEMMEAGEVPTTEGQPSGRPSDRQKAERPASGASGPDGQARRMRSYTSQARGLGSRPKGDVVTEASEDSFPASDPPGYNMGID